MPVHTNSTSAITAAAKPHAMDTLGRCSQCASAQAKVSPKNKGSAITSRESQDVRHIAADRQARIGCPR